jgi:molybdopterin biosynthesis enzyme
VLCHDVHGANGEVVVAKGRVLDATDVSRVLAAPWDELHVLALDAGDVHEDTASARLAAAAAGDGTTVRAPSAGHFPLVSQWRGVVEVEAEALGRVNCVDGVCVYTLFDGQVVAEGETVARAKIAPFAIAGDRLETSEAAARASGGVVRVRPFAPRRIGAVVQESLGEAGVQRFRDALAEKVSWFGSSLLAPAFVEPSPAAIGDALVRLVGEGADIVTLAGTKAMDPLDPAFEALERAGARMERHGVPAHPGSLFWLARLGDVPILGMPTCGLFSRATVFDLVLPRLLAGLPTGRDTLASLGHGGFLTRDMAFRFPPYRPSRDRGAVD